MPRCLLSLPIIVWLLLLSGPGYADMIALPEGALQTERDRSVFVAVPVTVFTRIEKGAPAGVMAEATDIILKRMGKTPVFIGMSMGEIPRAIADGQVGASALMVMTPANKDNVLFTEPVVQEYTTIAVRQGDGFKLNQLSDLRGRRIGGRVGYHYPLLAQDPEITIERFRSDGEVMRNLLLRKVDMVLMSTLSNVYSFRVEG
ncbi:MAG: transporter substrate-binding domain-containing protein, partial [Magnetococcales bacterium]|nr:transporter substrate-binding domain-containing protein [Magnetococcales bacterium]